jgi:hypothetical protein
MIFGDILTEIVCKLHELKAERDWRRGHAERRKRALRKKGWDELYDHMSKNSVGTAPGAAVQPASFTAREAAVEADRGEAAVVRPEEGSVEALGVLPLARPPRKGDV